MLPQILGYELLIVSPSLCQSPLDFNLVNPLVDCQSMTIDDSSQLGLEENKTETMLWGDWLSC